MNDLRWCCRCQRVSEVPDAVLAGSDLTCPACGAPGSNLQTWWSVREHNPHWPQRPSPGKAYRIRKVEGC